MAVAPAMWACGPSQSERPGRARPRRAPELPRYSPRYGTRGGGTGGDGGGAALGLGEGRALFSVKRAGFVVQGNVPFSPRPPSGGPRPPSVGPGEMHWNGGRYPPPSRAPAYAQPLSP